MHLPVDARCMVGPPKAWSLFVVPMRWRRPLKDRLLAMALIIGVRLLLFGIAMLLDRYALGWTGLVIGGITILLPSGPCSSRACFHAFPARGVGLGYRAAVLVAVSCRRSSKVSSAGQSDNLTGY